MSLKKGNYTKLLPDNDDKLDIKNALLALDLVITRLAKVPQEKNNSIEGTGLQFKTIKKKKINKGVLVNSKKNKI